MRSRKLNRQLSTVLSALQMRYFQEECKRTDLIIILSTCFETCYCVNDDDRNVSSYSINRVTTLQTMSNVKFPDTSRTVVLSVTHIMLVLV